LAGHLSRQARFAEAEELYREALAILLRSEGEDGRRVAVELICLGYLSS
jgi:hypothetical protein